MTTCEVCNLIPNIEPRYIIIEGKYWLSNLSNQDQTLLGKTYVTSKRHVNEVDQLTDDEELEFIQIRNATLRAIRNAFSPITFNIVCLKNDAFKANPDHTPSDASHVHWHIIPRYRTASVEINGEAFADPMPGSYLQPAMFEKHKPSGDTAAEITALIKKNLPQS